MNLVEFLQELSAKNVELWVDNGKLRYRGPEDVLTPALLIEIKQYKEKIILLLQKRTETATTNSLYPVARNGHIPLSFAQQRLWFLQQFEPDNGFYNISAAVHFSGTLNQSALEQSLNYMIRRHEALRTNFVVTTDGQATQVIYPERCLKLQIIDLQHLGETEQQLSCQELAATEAVRPFDLAEDLLVRSTLLNLTPKEHVLLLVMHHIVSDGWSMGVVVKELAAVYNAVCNDEPINLSELPIQYADYAVWQQQHLAGEVLASQQAYWQQQLATAPALLELPTDRPRPAIQTYKGAIQTFTLSQELTAALTSLSQRQGVTLFMTLLAAYQTLLYRYSGQTDICVGTPIANRNHREIEGLIGLFLNTLVLRSNLSGNPSFADLLSQVREVALSAYAHQDLPFEQLVEALQPERSLSHAPLFQVMFVLRTPMPPLQLPDLTLSLLPINSSTTNFDLTLFMEQTSSGLSGSIEYNTDLFDDSTIVRMVQHYENLLGAVVANPQTPVSNLAILTSSEQHQMLVEWNNTSSEYAKDLCMHQLFEQQVQKSPDAVAVEFDSEQLTYRELNAKANQLAHHLRSLGVGPEVLVGICTQRSTQMLVGLLAVLKAGGAYVPVDPNYPKERLEYILADSQVFVVLTQQHLLEQLEWQHGHVVLLDQDCSYSDNSSNPNSHVLSENIAYAIYTSGSTGQPKGVQIRHSAVVNFLSSMLREPGVVSSDVLVAVTTITFDIAVLELFLPLSVGARVVLSPEVMTDGGQSTAALAETASVMQGTPATWRLLMQTGFSSNQDLKILCGGEALSRELANQLLERTASLWNMYGPTETTIWSAVSQVQATSGLVSIGSAIANTQFYILDTYLQPVPVGVPGELHIGGEGLARGYLNRPELTAEKFIPNPFGEPGSRLYKTEDLMRYQPNGDLEYLGRIDHQVKIRGFRMELGEIEAVLTQHPNVNSCCAIVREDTPEDKRLVAYVVPHTHTAVTKSELRSFLKQKLPDYMVPTVFVMLDTLPLNSNGKVDRKALPTPDQTTLEVQAYVAPRNEVERLICAIWQQVLNLEKVGIHDNFFEIGGHSLLIIQIHSKLNHKLLEKFNRKISVVDLFKYPTISALAEYISQHKDAEKLTLHKINGRASKQVKDFEEPIAIIGMAGRFPGANNVEQFWQNLRDGVESISFFTDEELEASGIDPAILSDRNYVKANGLLEDVEMFDASFFGFSAREAEIMDPQHRLFLECAWEVLENAGYDSETYDGQIDVYAGAGLNNYLIHNLIPNRDQLESVGSYQILISNDKDFVPTRVSYKLNLKGPSINVNTACSTSLVAVQMGCQSLLNYQCDMVLAGGVSISLTQKAGYLYQEGMIFSPDGHCRAFDAQAQGTVAGNGVGIVLLKRLSDALADGDCIHAIIRGSAINNDGSLKVGYTAPSVEGQAAVISEAQAIAGIDAETITYIEAHGTGTVLGDPIEIAALTEAFGAKTQKKNFCAIGALKTNVGHLDAAAGVAGLIKTILALKHKLLPPTLNFEKPNPKIDISNSPFYVNTTLREWEANGTPRRAGVSSFGIGGTNAHVIVEEAPTIEPSGKSRPWQLLLLSAKTNSALESATVNLVKHLKEYPEINLADVAYTQSVGRRAFNHRRMVVCRDINEVSITLNSLDAKQVLTNFIEPKTRSVVFMFSGQGAQYVNMALELYQTEPTFHEQVDICSELLKPHLGLDLRHVLYPTEERIEEATQQIRQTAIAQPALFVIEYALAKLWIEWGIRPQAMIGHSIGEYVAACLANVFSLEDALILVSARGQMMQQLPSGTMLSVPLPEDKVQAFLSKELSLAAVNSPKFCVVSGMTEAVEALENQLAEQGVECRRLHTSHAFHSKMMDPILREFTEQVKKISLKSPQISYISNVTGTWITAAEATNPEYWANHLRSTVRFAEGVQQLLKEPEQILLEVGPGQTLNTLVKQHPDQAVEQVVLSSLRHPRDRQSDVAFLLTTLGKLWLADVQVDWSGFYQHEQRHRLPLPTYPFERQRYWIELQKQASVAKTNLETLSSTSPPRKKPNIADWFYIPSWKRSPLRERKLNEIPVQSNTLVFIDECGLGFQLVKKLELEGTDVVTVKVGSEFAQLSDHVYTLNPRQSNDYDALFHELRTLGKTPKTIVHLWSVTPNSDPELRMESVNEAQDLGLYSLLFLAQAFGKQTVNDKLQITVVSNNMQEVTGVEVLCPEKATLLGPVKVIEQEYPNINCCSIDVVIPSEGSWQEEKLTEQLLTELTTQFSDQVIAYRGLHRWVQTFEPVRLDKSSEATPQLRKGGVYLITGGLGAIGLVLAEHLAKTVQAKLVLIGRSALPSKQEWEQWLASHETEDSVSQKIKKIQELEELGAEVLVVSADVTSLQQMQEAVAWAKDQFGQINGVLHAAGVPGGSVIQNKTLDDIERILAPKMKGTLVLNSIFKDIELDFFALTSSITSILGGFGQVDYCSANAFLDAFAQYKNSKYRTFTVCTNWDTWQGIGMGMILNDVTLPPELQKLYGEIIQQGILVNEGVDAFSRILASKLPQVVVSTRDLQIRIEWENAYKTLFFSEPLEKTIESKPTHPRPELSNTYIAPRNELEQKIADIWQQLLGIEQVGIHDNFFELGGHSLLATQVISRMRKTFQVELPQHSLFEESSVAALAEHIERIRSIVQQIGVLPADMENNREEIEL
ncbi:MAG: amino acid adenylation domain-containing protein [Iphinoe sp. HA4291-MV1]|jgi:amino acid adenylation domain-containing protein|nr:amino acid adenylation domain-containing protein [Iphinoe sp. HA4291-MV1]